MFGNFRLGDNIWIIIIAVIVILFLVNDNRYCCQSTPCCPAPDPCCPPPDPCCPQDPCR